MDSYVKSSYLNVLFRELRSDKIYRIGVNSTYLHDDDVRRTNVLRSRDVVVVAAAADRRPT